MSQKLFTIYDAAQTVDVFFDPGSLIASGGFNGGAGKWTNVNRVDFYGSDGKPLCVFPCDSTSTTIDVTDVFVSFNLNFISLLGRSKNAAGFVGQLEVPQTEPIFVLGGVQIDGQPVIPTSAGATYGAIFAQLTLPPSQETSSTIGASEVPAFSWSGFLFGQSLIYRIRQVNLAGSSSPLPVFTLERDIPATDDFGLRRLPPPFSIFVALPTPGLALNKIALRAVQRPADSWFNGAGATPSNWMIEVAGFQSGTIAEFWQTAVVDRYIGALLSVLDTEVISLLPTLQSGANSLNDADWRLQLPVTGSNSGPLSLQLLGALNAPLPKSQAVSVSCDGFLKHSGASLAFSAQLANSPPNATPVNPWMSFQVTMASLTGDGDVRIGSIDLTLAPNASPQPEWSCLITFAPTGNLWLPRVNLSANQISLLNVTPGGQDDPADPQLAAAVAAASVAAGSQYQSIAGSFARQTALVIPVPPTNPIPRSLFLSFTENNISNQQLTLTLSASTPTNQNLVVMVIDPDPFTVALASLPDLTSTASAETNQFAQWSNSFPEGAGWRISAGAGEFQLLLPPQGVGEAMVTGNPGEPDATHSSDFRLSAAAQALIRTSSQIQRYAEPGWNLRRVLGYPGERAPGAGVDSMQFEMLYGLVCNVVTAGLSLSEMFSRLGGFAGPLTDAPTGSLALGNTYHPAQQQWFYQLNIQWAALYDQLLARPGVFELWDQERGFDVELSNGVSYELRDGANPLNGGVPSFKGGAQYALALDELLDTVTANPQSSSATLFQPRFSALGGSGKQRAGFNKDIIFVESDVSFGMVETLTITVIGRIANVWNKAKHVTVYERTVFPSRQFYLEQPLLQGRPLLRKTEEYVEILQKARAYPESGPATTGFLQGTEFKTIRMNVDSAWRVDVADKTGTAGWTIPLWRRDAQPADVYPQPHIVLQLATDPASGTPTRTAEIANPENLYFYTDPGQTTSDTDQWPAVQFIDFNISPPARSVTSSAVLDFPVEPGLGRFTYQLSAGATQIDLVSQRAPSPMASTLSNVTFMRGQSGLAYPADPAVQAAGTLHDHVHNALGELQKVAAAPGATAAQIVKRLADADLQGSVIKPFQAAVSQLNGFSDQSNFCANIADLAVAAFSAAATPVGNLWASLSAQIQQEILAAGAGIQATDDTLKQTLLAAVDTAFAGVESVAGMVVADLSNAQALAQQAAGGYASLIADLKNLETRINSATTDANWANCLAFLKRCQNDALAAVSDVQLLLTSVSYLYGNRAGANTALALVAADVDTFVHSLGTAIPAALGDIQSKAQQQAISDVQTIEKILQNNNPLATDLSTLAATLQGAAGSANQIAASVRSFRDQIRTATNGVTTTVLADFSQAIAGVLSGWPDFNTLLNGAVAAIKAQITGACTLFVGDVSKLLASVLDPTAVQNYLKQAGGDLADAIDNLQTTYDNQLDGVVQRVREALADTASPVSNAVMLMRAFGDAPAVPGLSFNLPDVNLGQVAYFYTTATQAGSNLFQEIVQQVPVSAGLTTAVAQASAALPLLQQLGIQNLPASALLDRIIPDAEALANLGLADIFPHLAGIDLSKLFSGISVPSEASNNIHISHRFDPQTLRAALDIVLDFPIEENDEVTLFSIGPATVTVENCNFHAEVHVTGGVGQSVSESSLGSITADWTVYIGGTEILAFEKTALTFDQSGKLHFDIEPARVRLAAVLQFIADFLEDLDLGGGFSLNVLPTGIQCVLSLPLPDFSGAVFGITNLTLGCSFGLIVSPEFAIQIGANLGAQEAPFTLTIFILGGAGWFEGAFSYSPDSGQITADVSIGILASASLSISLGPISGGVYLYFGITAEYHSAGGLNVGILIMLEGRVSLLGIIDADITLLLEAEYTSGGGLLGRGEVDISIKICWCFTLDIHQSVEYTFGNQAAVAAQQTVRPRISQPTTTVVTTTTPDATGSYAAAVNNRINYLS